MGILVLCYIPNKIGRRVKVFFLTIYVSLLLVELPVL